ncbi:MAG TPA: hypothetical protein VIO61_13465 [Anaerolineaceae bacterium]
MITKIIFYNGGMIHYILPQNQPVRLALASGLHATEQYYTNDHIWELALNNIEPDAIVLQTTFGLRARSFKIFPQFRLNNEHRASPQQFHQFPQMQALYPGYIRLSLQPFSGIEAILEYWINHSNIIQGKVSLRNIGHSAQNLHMDWIALLTPLDSRDEYSRTMDRANLGNTSYLQGEILGLHPVFLLGEPGMYQGDALPSAGIDVVLKREKPHYTTWVCATLEDEATSLHAAQEILGHSWEPHIARYCLLNDRSMLEFHTGNPKWDLALQLGQVTLQRNFYRENLSLPNPTCLKSRLPDQGFSRRGDGSDYPNSWSGQTTLDLYLLSSYLSISNPELLKGMFENFLAVQNERGFIDGRPGLGGQRANHLAQPLLATLAKKIAYSQPDPKEWLSAVYPRLKKFLSCWFSPDQDADGDGFPEWRDPIQTGLEDAPLTNRWDKLAEGIDASMVESPALAALLYHECASLSDIACIINCSDDEKWFSGKMEILKNAVNSMWNAQDGTFYHRDFQTHQSPRKILVGSYHSSGSFSIHQQVDPENRLVIRLVSHDDNTLNIRLVLKGINPDGIEVEEEISNRNFTWSQGMAKSTSKTVFRQIESIEIFGLRDDINHQPPTSGDPTDPSQSLDRLELFTANYQVEDCSLLMPIWAEMVDPDRTQQVIDGIYKKRYLQAYGIPLCPLDKVPPSPISLSCVNILWNTFIGEALLVNNRNAEAADLVTRLMDVVSEPASSHLSFWQYYHSRDGQPFGERNHLFGLPPLGLFLQVLGLEKISSKEVILKGNSPFPATITVKYEKTVVVFQPEQTTVTFPGGQSIVVQGSGLHHVSLS